MLLQFPWNQPISKSTDGKLTDLDFDCKKFLAAHFLLISELNQKLSQLLSDKELLAFQTVTVRGIRSAIATIDQVEVDEVLRVLDEKITPTFYPFVFSAGSGPSFTPDSIVPFTWHSDGSSF